MKLKILSPGTKVLVNSFCEFDFETPFYATISEFIPRKVNEKVVWFTYYVEYDGKCIGPFKRSDLETLD